MDERLKKRMMWFYFAGAVNLVLGFYVLFQGPAMLGTGTALLIALIFFGFAAIDLWYPRLMAKQWAAQQEQIRLEQEQAAASGAAGGQQDTRPGN